MQVSSGIYLLEFSEVVDFNYENESFENLKIDKVEDRVSNIKLEGTFIALLVLFGLVLVAWI